MLDCDAENSELGIEEFDTLLDIASELNVDMPDTENILKAYEEHLQFICVLLEPFDHAVFQGLSLILSEGLNKLIDKKRQLNSDECVFLRKIPEILSEYAFIPTSKIPDVHLLKHFKDMSWIRPVSADEEKKFLKYLVEGPLDFKVNDKLLDANNISRKITDIEIENNVDEEIDLSDFVGIDVDIAQSENSNSDIHNFNHSYDDNNDENDDVIDLSDYSDEFLAETQVKQSNSIGNVADVDLQEDILDTIDIATVNIEDDSSETEVSLLDFIGNHEVSDITHEMEAELNHQTVNNDESSLNISQDQKELVDLIADELKEIIEEKELITIKSADYSSELKDHLINIADQVENISNAVDLIGLEGLGNAGRMLSGNIHMLALNKTSLTKEQTILIEVWPEIILAYLNNIANDQMTADIIQYLKDPSWPEPLSEKTEVLIGVSLSSPQMKDDEKSNRQSVASAEDMSLVLPDDVNPELLEGLLQDLPVQSGEFSVAIQNLQDQNNIEYLEVAQRIAHTLKGAGNVVGVKGIANLTHNLEDILEIQSKAKKLPSGDLLNVLIDAADCLETMSEALLGIDEPPDNGLLIFQSVLDWANK